MADALSQYIRHHKGKHNNYWNRVDDVSVYKPEYEDCLYYAKDTGCIYINGTQYGSNVKSLDVSMDSDTWEMYVIIEWMDRSDNTSLNITSKLADHDHNGLLDKIDWDKLQLQWIDTSINDYPRLETSYVSGIHDDAVAPYNIGDIEYGTPVSEVGRCQNTYNDMIDRIVFPRVRPKVSVEPYVKIKSAVTICEVGAGNCINEEDLTCDVCCGVQTLVRRDMGPAYAEPDISYYYNDDETKVFPDETVVIAPGNNVFNVKAVFPETVDITDTYGYSENSSGESYVFPSVTVYDNVCVEGVYPIYATDTNLENLSKQPLKSCPVTDAVFEFDLCKEIPGNTDLRKSFAIPEIFSDVIIEQQNPFGSGWTEVEDGAFETSEIEMPVGDTVVNYIQYKKADDRWEGAQRMRIKFNRNY